MLFIVSISAGVFIFESFSGGIIEFIRFYPNIFQTGQIWRFFTWLFIPINSGIIWVAISLYFYYFIGSTLEREWGTGKFTIFYFSGVLLNVIYGISMWYLAFRYVSLSPLYLNSSMLFAFATLFPEHTIRLFFVIPVKIKWLAVFVAALYLYEMIASIVSGQIFAALLPVVALMNYILICGDDLLSLIKPMKFRTSPQVISFKKAARQVKREMADKPYRHKCAVCGKTDTDHPELEFRYCSRCNGYHCFCIEHINNHIHFE